MVAAFDYCLHGKGGAAPSIDTAMHGLVDAAHVDHLHPDSGIAIATAADGEELTQTIFGDKVVWVPWRRPGFQLGLDIAEDQGRAPRSDRLHPRRPRHHRLGRHQRRGRAELAVDHRDRRGLHRRARAARAVRPRARRLRRRCPRPSVGPRPLRSCRRSARSPRRTGRWSATSPTATSCWTSSPRSEHPRLAALGTSCPDHFLRTKVKPLVLDLPADRRRSRSRSRGCVSCTRPTARTTRRYYDRNAAPRLAGDPGRRPADRAGARRRHVQLRQGQADRPRRRRVLRQRDQRHARRGGTVHVRADRRGGEVPHRVLGAGGGQAASACRRPSRSPRGSRSSPVPPPASARRSPTSSPRRALSS